MLDLRRREFVALLGGAAVAWPLAAWAQQTAQRVRRISVLADRVEVEEGRRRLAAFQEALQQLGWSEGGNVRIDFLLAEGDPERLRSHAAKLVAAMPDALLAIGSTSVAELRRATSVIPIVFVTVSDPVAAGYVDTLARPGGNVTGFANFEYSLSSKWLELLKEIVPRVVRAGVIRNPANPSGIGQFAAIQAVAPSLSIDLRPIDVRDARDIERTVTMLAQSGNAGLIVTSAGASMQSELIIALAARHRLPTVYPFRFHVAAGGLISYGPDFLDQYRSAAGYVDRILKGENPAELPVQAPTKYEMVLNLKTAKALGLEVPATLLARADEVIE